MSGTPTESNSKNSASAVKLSNLVDAGTGTEDLIGKRNFPDNPERLSTIQETVKSENNSDYINVEFEERKLLRMPVPKLALPKRDVRVETTWK